MGNFSRDGGSRGRQSFGGSKNFRSHNSYDRGGRGDRTMYSVVCSNCGKDCKVPFNPTGDKPVYCSECFEKTGNRDSKRSFDRPRQYDRNPRNDGSRIQLDSVNAKLDLILNLLQSKEKQEVSSSDKIAVDAVVENIKKEKPANTKKALEV